MSPRFFVNRLYTVLSRSDHRLIWFVLFCCSIPYFGLRAYLSREMHSTDEFARLPEPWLLAFLLVLGLVIPAIGVVLVLRRLIRDRNQFRIRRLLEAYLCLILLFATGYAILQSSSETPAIHGMTALWSQESANSLEGHVARLHGVYADSLYLSVMTITTVGFGDIAPVSFWARALTALEGLAGVGYLGLVLGHYFSICIVPQAITNDGPS